jgi:hypothetical protein
MNDQAVLSGCSTFGTEFPKPWALFRDLHDIYLTGGAFIFFKLFSHTVSERDAPLNPYVCFFDFLLLCYCVRLSLKRQIEKNLKPFFFAGIWASYVFVLLPALSRFLICSAPPPNHGAMFLRAVTLNLGSIFSPAPSEPVCYGWRKNEHPYFLHWYIGIIATIATIFYITMSVCANAGVFHRYKIWARLMYIALHCMAIYPCSIIQCLANALLLCSSFHLISDRLLSSHWEFFFICTVATSPYLLIMTSVVNEELAASVMNANMKLCVRVVQKDKKRINLDFVLQQVSFSRGCFDLVCKTTAPQSVAGQKRVIYNYGEVEKISGLPMIFLECSRLHDHFIYRLSVGFSNTLICLWRDFSTQ